MPGSGGTGTSEFTDFAVGSDIDITGLTSTSESAVRISAALIKSSDGSDPSNVRTVTVSGLDFTNPTVSSAATDVAGDTITLTMSENVQFSQDVADWVLSGVSAGTPTIDSVTGSGTSTITIEISTNLVANGDTVTLAYTDSDSDVRDPDGNNLQNFSGTAVTNNVPGGGNFAGVTYSSTGIYENAAFISTMTSHAFAIGTAQTDRVVYAVIGDQTGSPTRTITSCTIGGVTATLVHDASSFVTCAVYRAVVPTGTTAVVVVEEDSSWGDNSWVDVFYARDCTEANATSDTTAADPHDVSINPNAGSSIIAAAQTVNSGSTASTTGVGVTLDSATDINSSDTAAVGHANSVSTGAADWGFDYASGPSFASVLAFEVRQA